MNHNQKKLEHLTKEIYIIKNNHLRHMDDSIKRMETRIERMDQRLWAIILILVASVLIGMLK